MAEKARLSRRINPWDRQPKEHDEAWRSFKHYRDMGLTRTTPKTAEELGKSLNTILTYSSRFSWVLRAAAWDAEQDRLDQLWMQQERKKAVTRHVKQAQQLTSKWLVRLQQLDPSQLSPSDVIRYADVATRMEREALEMDRKDINVNVSGTVEAVTSLSAEDTRMRLAQLNAEIKARLEEQKMAGDGEQYEPASVDPGFLDDGDEEED